MRGLARTRMLLLLALYLQHVGDAFPVHPSVQGPPRLQQQQQLAARQDDDTTSSLPPTTLGRAVDCSQAYGLCDMDELLSLADALESFQDQALFHTPHHYLHRREVKDRFAIADVLRLEAQLSLRQEHLRDDNIFCKDAKESLAMKSRDQWMELVDMF